jgi:hypothetical protein
MTSRKKMGRLWVALLCLVAIIALIVAEYRESRAQEWEDEDGVWVSVEEYEGVQIGDNICEAIEVFGNRYETWFPEDGEVVWVIYPGVEFVYESGSSRIVEINVLNY